MYNLTLRKIAKLVYKYNNYGLWYANNYSYCRWAYKPTNIAFFWAPHIADSGLTQRTIRHDSLDRFRSVRWPILMRTIWKHWKHWKIWKHWKTWLENIGNMAGKLTRKYWKHGKICEHIWLALSINWNVIFHQWE